MYVNDVRQAEVAANTEGAKGGALAASRVRDGHADERTVEGKRFQSTLRARMGRPTCPSRTGPACGRPRPARAPRAGPRTGRAALASQQHRVGLAVGQDLLGLLDIGDQAHGGDPQRASAFRRWRRGPGSRARSGSGRAGRCRRWRRRGGRCRAPEVVGEATGVVRQVQPPLLQPVGRGDAEEQRRRRSGHTSRTASMTSGRTGARFWYEPP